MDLMSTFREMTVKGKCGHDVHISRKGLNMNIVKTLGKLPIKLFIRIIQIPLTIIYFILSFFGSVISGLGWLFGVMIFGATICLWAFGEFDSWYQVATALALSTAIVILPGWLTEFIGEGILFLKKALSDISI